MKQIIRSIIQYQKQNKVTKVHLYFAVFGIILFLLIAITIPAHIINKQQITRSNAAGLASIEAANGTRTGNTTLVNDPNASGGQYVRLGVTRPTLPNPVGWWKLDENTGASANDSSGNNHPGTLTNGPTWTTGYIGQAVNFDGVDDYISIGDSDLFSPTRLTVYAWIKRTGNSGRIVSKDNNPTTRGWEFKLTTTNTVELTIWNQSGVLKTVNGGATVDTNWHHVAGTWDGTTIRTYLDGVQQNSGSLSGTSVNNSSVPLEIGRAQWGIDYFSGQIDDVRVYDRARDASEVQQLFSDNISNTPTPTPASASTPTPPTGKIALGVYTNTWDYTWESFTTKVGGPLAAINWYEKFARGFNKRWFDWVHSQNLTPVVSWSPSKADNTSITWDRVAAGDVDTLIHNFARDAVAWSNPIYVRFNWEMNLEFNGTTNTPATFVSMWRHVHDIFIQEGATNVRWFWCPNVWGSDPAYYRPFYPGDAYVDYMGFNSYNWGGNNWSTPRQVFGPTYAGLSEVSNKAMIIGETASDDRGGDKAAWITEAFLNDIPTLYPHIIGVLYFNFNQDNANWQVDTSPKSLAAFRAVVASPLYQGRLP